jgi:hypothetical protein
MDCARSSTTLRLMTVLPLLFPRERVSDFIVWRFRYMIFANSLNLLTGIP